MTPSFAPFFTMNILGLSVTYNRSSRSGVSPPVFLIPQLLTLYKDFVRPCIEYSLHVWGGSTHTAQIGWNQKLFVSSIPLLWLTVFSPFLLVVMLHPLLSFITIFMLTALLILLTACLPSSCDLAAQDFLLPPIPILSNSLMQELISTLSHSLLPLVNSETLSLPLHLQLPMTWLC